MFAPGQLLDFRGTTTLVILAAAAAFHPVTLVAADSGPEPLQSAAQIQRLTDSQLKQLVSIRLQGVVLGIDRAHRGIAFQDDTGLVWLELDRLPAELEVGSRIALEGKALAGDDRVVVGWTPVIDQHYNVGGGVGACRVHLAAGHHPFELVYIQREGPQALAVGITGPGISATNIPASMLGRREPNGDWQTGMSFACYAGVWTEPPDFTGQQPVAAGVAAQFDSALAPVGTNFALRFTGSIAIGEAGFYEFDLRADDNAQFRLDYEAATRIEILGGTPITTAERVVPGQLWNDSPEPSWVEAEGVVRHVGVSGGRLHFELVAETGKMQVTVSDGDPTAAEMLLNSRVRVTGLGRSVTSPAGSRTAGWLLAPDMRQVVIWQAAELTWMRHAVTAISNLTVEPPEGAANPVVRIRGEVTEVEPGRRLVVMDGTGRVEVVTPRARIEDEGTRVEVLGRLMEEGFLHHAAYREAGQADRPSDRRLPTLTTIEQIRRLRPEQVTQSYPLKFQGVVTFVFEGGLRAHVQGESEGIYVSCVRNNLQPLRVGDLCEFEGYSSPGAFSPVVTYRRRTVLARGQMPEPLRPDWSRLMNGSLDSQWVELQGVVLRVSGFDLVLGVRGGEVTARVFEGNRLELAGLAESVVRIRGTVRAFSGSQRQFQRVLLQVTSPAQISVEEPAPVDPFRIPFKSVAELYLFDPNAASLHRVRTLGQVVHVRDGVGYLMDGTNGMRFVARALETFEPGDRVEVVGFPETEGFSPVMRQSLVKVLGRAPLPKPQALLAQDLMNRTHDSTLVEVHATLLNVRTNQADYLLELQADSHLFTARLNQRSGLLPLVPTGSEVRIAGLYSIHQHGANASNAVQPFELLLNSPSDLVVLRRPSWWNLQHTLAVLALMSLVLVLSIIWITALRRRVERRTRELREEIEVRKRAEGDLQEKTRELQNEIAERIQLHSQLVDKKTLLEKEIEERKRMELEVEQIHRQLMDASRQAGQAEVASSVLHNVGNVLNSVNVSTAVLASRLHNWRAGNLTKAAALLTKRTAELGEAVGAEDALRQLPGYLEQLAGHLDKQREQLLAEVKDLGQNVEHIKEIVAMQQNYARLSGVIEKVYPREMMESAVKMHVGALERHDIRVVREFKVVPEILADRHKILQILVNLLHNAKYACDESAATQKQITVRIRPDGNRIAFEVCDNGIGIATEHMSRLFSHGFTTRRNGHGFGLHSAANAAREMGGSLAAASDGPGRGATFTLVLPLEPPARAVDQQSRAAISSGLLKNSAG